MSRRYLLLSVVSLFFCPVGFAFGEEPATFKLDYRELTQRTKLKFRMNGTAHTGNLGMLNWDFPPSTFATVGLEPKLTTFCLEALVPIVEGNRYTFQNDPLGLPKTFALKDDDAGRKDAIRRAKYMRELFGRYYSEVIKDPDANAVAFQLAIWEIVGETAVIPGEASFFWPAGLPVAFSLRTGSFQTDYGNAEVEPAFVPRAENYLQGLTGDDTIFTTNPLLAGQELVRLTGLPNDSGIVAQSQLALRMLGGVSTGGTGIGAGIGPIGPTLGGGGFGGFAPGLGGLGGGLGGGFGGGIGGGFGGGFIAPSTTVTPTTDTPGNITTQKPSDINPILPEENPNPNPNPNPTPTPTPTETPAPPALILGLVGIALFGIRRYRQMRGGA